MTIHELKTVQPYFDAVASGEKNFDVRPNDRSFQRGDTVELYEWHDISTSEFAPCRLCRYAGPGHSHYVLPSNPLRRRISYVFSGDPRFTGVVPGYVVLGLAPLPDPEETSDASAQP